MPQHESDLVQVLDEGRRAPHVGQAKRRSARARQALTPEGVRHFPTSPLVRDLLLRHIGDLRPCVRELLSLARDVSVVALRHL